MSAPPTDKTARIRELNDLLRTTFTGGRVLMTQGVNTLPHATKVAALVAVQRCDTFTHDSDPHGEHDFGIFELAGEIFYWKIDCYNPELDGGSEDPSDPDQTTRVLTIMLAIDY